MQASVTTKHNLFLSATYPSSRCFIKTWEVIQDNYTIELRDRVTGHGVFQGVLLSPVTLNKIP